MNHHGGNIYEYEGVLLVDFSSNINPLGVPSSFEKALQENLYQFTQYPDIQYKGLRTAIAEYVNIQDIEDIVVGNGAVELIYKTIAAVGSKRVYTMGPTFSEYSRAASLSGAVYEEVNAYDTQLHNWDLSLLLEKIQPDSTVVLCNPNNPIGTLLSKTQMCRLTEFLAEKNSMLIIDEAFMEFTDTYPSDSMISEIETYQNLMIIKAATKFFGMPGIRLGYGISKNKILRDKIKSSLEPWNINTAAVIAGSCIFEDAEYIQKSRGWIQRERNRMYQAVKEIKELTIYPSSVNYHLMKSNVKGLDAWKIQELLVEKNFLIRTPEGFQFLTPYHFRLAVKDADSNNALIEALKEVVGGY